MLPECQWVIHSNIYRGRREREDKTAGGRGRGVGGWGSVMYGPGQLVCTQIKEGNHD